MKNKWIGLICALSFTASGQIGNYLGPGVLTRGAGDIGTRSGQSVDLRYFFDITGVFDTGIQPYSVDATGHLLQVNGLYGEEVDAGVYGTHRWRQAQLGLDYKGNFTHYQNNSFLDGSNQNVTLGYTYQQSRRIVYELQAVGGTSSLGFGAPGFYSGVPVSGTTDAVNTPTALLFDNRMYYLQPGMTMSFVQTPRTIYTIGGEGFFIRRHANGLADLNGYDLHGAVRHRLSKTRSIEGTYEHVHYDFPPAFGQSDMDLGMVSFSNSLGRRWVFNIGGGVYHTEVQGIRQVALDPVVAALLGITSGQQAFYREDIFPSAHLSLTGNYRRSSITFAGGETIVPGNGVYLTSREQNASVGYSYTALRKWNFGLNGGYSKLLSVGQGIQPYTGFTGGLGVTYSLTSALHLIARADSRYQQIDLIGYNRTGYRVSFGVAFSPGSIPLSLW